MDHNPWTTPSYGRKRTTHPEWSSSGISEERQARLTEMIGEAIAGTVELESIEAAVRGILATAKAKIIGDHVSVKRSSGILTVQVRLSAPQKMTLTLHRLAPDVA